MKFFTILTLLAVCRSQQITTENCETVGEGRVCAIERFGNNIDGGTRFIIFEGKLRELPELDLNDMVYLSWIKADYCELEELPLWTYKSNTLQELSFVGNHLKDLGSGWFKNLKKLRSFNLQRNKIEKLDSDCFNGMINLQILNLNQNRISKILTYTFLKLTSLKTLTLSYNQLEVIEKNLFPTSLKTLDLSGNSIKYVYREAFKDLDLTTLDVRGNNMKKLYLHSVQNFHGSKAGLTEIHMNFGKHMAEFNANDNFLSIVNLNSPAIDELNLSNNNLSEIVFQRQITIQKLDISRNNLLPNFSKVFKNINLTHSLNLSSNEITNDGMESFNKLNLRNLRSLDLSSNLLTSFNFSDLQALDNLYDLDISNNQIVKAHFEDITDSFVESFKMISIVNNPWKCSDLRDFMKFCKSNSIEQTRGKRDFSDDFRIYQFYIWEIGCFLDNQEVTAKSAVSITN